MGREQWHPDIEVTEELARKSIEDQFTALALLKTIKCIGEGWDNKVFLVNGDFVFRFPHRKVAAQLLERENVVLKQLQSKFTLEIPNPKYVGHPSQYYPYPFHGYRIIKGSSGCHASLTSTDRIASIIPLAIFLKKLHGFAEKQAEVMGAKPQVFDRSDTDKIVNALTERVEKIITKKVCDINKSCFQHELILAQKIKLPIENKVLVHGDLYCRHLIFKQGQLTGIIDWGDVGINTPAIDLSVIYSFYPKNAHKKFFEIYGEIEPHILQYARFLGLYSVLTVMLYGQDMGDDLLVADAKIALKRINPDLFERP